MLTQIKQASKKKVFLNFSYLTVGSFMSQLLSLVALTLITRIFSPSNYGVFTFLIVQAQLLTSIGDLGTRNINIKTIARKQHLTKLILYNGIQLRILSVSVLLVLYIIYNYYYGRFTNNQLLLLGLFAIVSCLTDLFESIFWGYRRMMVPSIINILYSGVWVILIIFLPVIGTSVELFFSVFLLINIVKGLVFYFFLVRFKMINGKPYRFIIYCKKIIRQSMPYFTLALLMIPIELISNNYLDLNSTKEEIGVFNLAKRLLSPVTILIGLALSSLFPDLSALWTRDENRFNSLVGKGFKYFILSALFLCSMFTLLAKEALVLLLPDKYYAVIQVCQIQVWYVFLMGINTFIGTVWAAANKEQLFYKTAIIQAIICTPFLYYGSKYGAYGISCGFVASAAIYEIYLWNLFRKSVNINFENDLKYWLAAITMFFTSVIVSENVHPVIKIFIAFLITGGGVLYFMKAVKPEIGR